MRSVVRHDDFAVTELRGGTHLVLRLGAAEPGDAPFDLMVDDLQQMHDQYRASGLDVSDIVKGDIHDVFDVEDPDGNRVTVRSSHVVGPV
jgi:hypothetical protein